jgi:hypothetical protein
VVFNTAALAAMVGGLLPTLLVSRLLIFILRRIFSYSIRIILTGHLLSLCISILLFGFGLETDGFDNRIDTMLSWMLSLLAFVHIWSRKGCGLWLRYLYFGGVVEMRKKHDPRNNTGREACCASHHRESNHETNRLPDRHPAAGLACCSGG